MILFDILIIILLFSFFAFTHTWLASNKIKEALSVRIGNKIAFYRLFYNLSSILFFGFFYFLSPKPDLIIYDLHYPFDIITFALQVLSLVGFYWASSKIDFKEFVGIEQIKRYLKNTYNILDSDAKQNFQTDGAFKLVRHPIYLFSILFLGLRPTMDLFYLVMFVCVCCYFYIGSIFEEKKLIEKFGDKYTEYQKSTPRLLPIKFLIKR